MFCLLLSSAYQLSQGLSNFLCSASEELHKKLGGSIARLADLNCQRDIPYHGMACPGYKMGELAGRGQLLLKDWAWHQSMSDELLSCASLVWCFFTCVVINLFTFIIVFYFIVIIKLFLFQPMGFFPFSNSPPLPSGSGRGVSE